MKFHETLNCIAKGITIFIVLLIFLPLRAEDTTSNPIDSLFQCYNTAAKGERLALANSFFEANRVVLDTLYVCDEKQNPEYVNAIVNYAMAEYYNKEGNFQEAEDCLAIALANEEFCQNDYFYGLGVAIRAIVYARLSNFTKALEYAEESLRLFREQGKPGEISNSLNTIACISVMANQNQEAKKYILEAIKIERSIEGSKWLPVRLGMAAEIFSRCGELEEALAYGREALELEKDPNKIPIRKSQLGGVLANMDHNEEAYKMMIEAKNEFEAYGNINSLSILLAQLGKVCTKLNRTDESIDYFKQAYNLCQQTGNKMIESDICQKLYYGLRQKHLAEAVTYLERYVELKDQIYNDELAEQLQAFNVKFEKAETQHELAIRDAQLKRHRLWTQVAVFLAILAIIIVGLMAGLLKAQRRNNKMLQQTTIVKDELLRIANEEKLQAESARQQILQVAEHISSLGDKGDVELTKRELEIIQLFCCGLMSKEIADQLKISVRTVEAHKAHIYRKLGINTSVELLRFAEQKGLLNK